MDALGLQQDINYLGCSGIILSPEQKAALQTSLVILQNENKFKRVYFWGKIAGIRGDYFIAQGVYRNEFGGRSTFYSQDCMLWALLPPATEVMRTECKIAEGRFTGDPSFDYEHVNTVTVGDGDDAKTEEETKTVKEEIRLTSIISEIDQDVWIVPRGAFVRTATGEVCSNRNFEGLHILEASKLCSYMHFRPPVLLAQKTLLEQAHLDKAVDFMDTLEEDIPRGSWSLQFDRGSGLVILRSMLWLGYVFFHVPGTRHFGSIYFGTGQKNQDLAFML
ncbi:radial spoke head protein 9 homolog [Babylonia areolata]|uniref:radial spoke head protein 9 homolog n=1 Tax=Babylonia areolata TaxID=304850 RepID=UPI003FD1A4ED